MNKAKKYTVNGAVWIGVGNALLNIFKQLNEKESGLRPQFVVSELLLAAGKGAAIGAGAGFVIGTATDYINAQQIQLNTDFYLNGLINEIRLCKATPSYLGLKNISEEIIAKLQREYGAVLKCPPTRIGSTEKGTALQDNFDIDISLSFNPDSFRSTQDMYLEVFDFFKSLIGSYSIIDVQKQRKSIGVWVSVRGEEKKIDIVPCKVTQTGGNRTAGYLHVYRPSLLGDNSSYTKTDLHLIRSLRLNSAQQKIVVLLKNWRDKNALPLKSCLIENLVLDAYGANYGAIPREFTEKVVMVIRHIGDNLGYLALRSIENTNNILTNISGRAKTEIIYACNRLVEDFDYQPNSIIKSLE